MTTAEETIETPALGRPFRLGMLYDCRKDSLIPGMTLWEPWALKKDLDVKPQPYTDIHIFTSDSMEEKTKALSMATSLRGSFLSGLVDVNGAANFLKDTKSSKNQVRVILQYSTTTRFEQLTMNQLGRKNVSCSDVFQQRTATHVVTALLYGAQAFFVFDQEASSSEHACQVQGKLKAMVAAITAEGAVSQQTKTAKCDSQINYTFYGDFSLKSNPVTYEQTRQTFLSLPQLLGKNEEKVVPVKVWLYPLKKLESKAAQVVREISTGVVVEVQSIIDKMNEISIRCNDVLKESSATFPGVNKKLQHFKDMCRQYSLTFKKCLAIVLPLIREGGAETSVLIDILKKKEESPFGHCYLNAWLEEKEKEISFLRYYISFLEKADVISAKSTLHQAVLSTEAEYVLSFTFPSLTQQESYLSALENYLRLECQEERVAQAAFQNANKPSPVMQVVWNMLGYSTPAPDMVDNMGSRKSEASDDSNWSPFTDPQRVTRTLWYNSQDCSKRVKALSKSFLEFALANAENKKVQFILASSEDERNLGVSVYLYESGSLSGKVFDLPPKPRAPTIQGIGFESVALKLDLLSTDSSEAFNYTVEYKPLKCETWQSLDTRREEEEFTVCSLLPNTEYQFRYSAVCALGLSLSSDLIDKVKTLPTGPPGELTQNSVEAFAITISWLPPTTIGVGVQIHGYKIEYRVVPEERSHLEDKWMEEITGKETGICRIAELNANTWYTLRVSVVCEDGGVGAPSDEIEVRTLKLEESKILPYSLISPSTLLREGKPAIYKLPLKRTVFEQIGMFQKFTLGQETLQHTNKVIFMLGAASSGKTTLINAMVNYTLGVQWKDTFRFTVIDDVTNENQAERQTCEVTAYKINFQEGFKVPYSLTIVDTAGFGNASGIEQDQKILQQIQELFLTSQEIDHVDAVCLVVQASAAPLTHAHKYIYDSVLSIFGRDIEGNIQVLVTFADEQTPPVLDAIIACKVPCPKDDMGIPVHFKFPRSVLVACDTSGGQAGHYLNVHRRYQTMALESMGAFFTALTSLKSQSLNLTKKVLGERQKLEVAVQQLEAYMKDHQLKKKVLEKTKHCLEQHLQDMNANEHFDQNVKVTEPVQEQVTGSTSLNCEKCHFTCHYPCLKTGPLSHCSAMGWNGRCKVCPGKCKYYEHTKQEYTWNYEVLQQNENYAELKEKYNKASEEAVKTKNLVKQLSDELLAIKASMGKLSSKVSNSFQQLQEIGLRLNPLLTPEYIDSLILSEDQERSAEFQERKLSLKTVREHAVLIRKVSTG